MSEKEPKIVVSFDEMMDLFPLKPNERFTQRMVYFWLLAKGPARLDLNALAREWRWQPEEVESFLAKMVEAGLARIEAGHVHGLPMKED